MKELTVFLAEIATVESFGGEYQGKCTQEIISVTDSLQSTKYIRQTPCVLGTDFCSFFCVNIVEQNMAFKGVYSSLASISTEISFKLFGNYVHYNFQSTMHAALKSIVNLSFA